MDKCFLVFFFFKGKPYLRLGIVLVLRPCSISLESVELSCIINEDCISLTCVVSHAVGQ